MSDKNIARSQMAASNKSHRLSRCQVVLNKRLLSEFCFQDKETEIIHIDFQIYKGPHAVGVVLKTLLSNNSYKKNFATTPHIHIQYWEAQSLTKCFSLPQNINNYNKFKITYLAQKLVRAMQSGRQQMGGFCLLVEFARGMA